MDIKHRKKYLTQAHHHLENLRRTESMASYVLMQEALLMAEASLNEIGTNQADVDALVPREIRSICLRGPNSKLKKQMLYPAMLHEAKSLMQDLRSSPTLQGLYQVREILDFLQAPYEDAGTTKQEVKDLARRACLAQIREQIRNCVLSKKVDILLLVEHQLTGYFQLLETSGLSKEDILSLLQEIHEARAKLGARSQERQNKIYLH